MTDTPREVFDTFVKRSYEAWRKTPQNLMLADCAVHQANVMLERLVRYENPTLSGKKFDNKVKKRRTELATANSDYRLVSDIDDAHKHLELRDRNRPVTSWRQTVVRFTGGSWKGWGDSWGETWGASREVVVQLDTGSRRPLAVILKNVIDMWESLLP